MFLFAFPDLQYAINQSPLLAYLAAFLGGVVSCLAPCVLVMIPLAIGFVGGYSTGERLQTILFSLAFGLGLSITFTAMGAAASLLGSMFGNVGKWWNYLLGGIAIIMGLNLLGVFEFNISLPAGFQPRQKGYLGALILGIVFGLLLSPCASPVLTVVLAFVASRANVLYGITLLFVYSLGYFVFVFLAGASAGIIQSITGSRRGERAIYWIRRFSGGIILLVGLYILIANF